MHIVCTTAVRFRVATWLFAAALVLTALGWPESASAQSSTWSAGTGLWSDSSNWSGGVIADGSGNTARFTTTGTTTLDTGRTIGTIAVAVAGVRAIDGAGTTLTLASGAGTPTLTGTTGSTLGIATVIDGTQGFLKTGTSTLILTGANIFSGSAVIQTGTAIIQNLNALGISGAGNQTVVASGAQLRITGGVSGVISESFALSGRGNPTNAAVGAGGAIRVQSSAVTLAGGIAISGSSTEVFPDSSSSLTIAGDVTGTGGFIMRNNVTVSGNMSHNGFINRWSGGTGVVTLSGSNSYTGGTAVDNGPMVIGGPYAIPATTSLTVTGGSGFLDLNGNDITIRTFGWRDDGVNPPSPTTSTAGVISDNSTTPGTTTITVTSGSFQLGSDNNPGTAINDGGVRKLALKVASADMQNIEFRNPSSTFSGGLTLMTGSGRGTRLNIQDPLVNTGSPGAITSSILGTGTVTIGLAPTDRAQFYMGPGTVAAGVGSTVLNDMVFNTAAGADTPSGVLVNATEAIFAGKLTAGQAPVSFATGSIIPSSVVVLTGRVTSTGASGGLRLVGNGQIPGITVRLANATGTANDYQGATSVEANTTLVLGLADQVPNGVGKSNVSVVGSFGLGGFSETINGLTGSGSVDGGSGAPTLTVGDGDATASFSGVIRNSAGVLSLTKIGAGVQTLTGANTFTGPTTVSQGTLQLANANALSSSAVTVAAGAKLTVGPQVAASVPSLVNNGLVDVGLGGLTVASGQTAETIVAGIVAGRNNGTWDGTSGITSSAAATQSERAVGWLDNGGGSFTVAFAAAGDWNVNGVVDFDDVLQFVSANLYDTGLPATWADGDFDYNGVVDFDDVLASVSAGLFDTGPYNTAPGGLMVMGFGGDDPGLMNGGFTAVPEPTASVLLAAGLAAWGLARRQRRTAGGSGRSLPA